MKARSVLILLLLFPLFVCAKSTLDIQRWQTKNGAQVYFVQAIELHMVDIQIAFTAGSAFDNQLPGLAALTNTMLSDGADQLSADQIAEQFDDVGAIYVNDINRTLSMIGLRSLTDPKYLNPALQTFSKVLVKPTFPQEQFEREQRTTIGALIKEEQLPDSVAQKAFYQALYGQSSLAHSPLGTKAGVKKITVSAIKHFYQRYYVAHNALIAIVGDISHQQAEKIANETVGLLPEGSPAPELLSLSDTTQAKSIHIPFPAEQTNIYLGQMGIARSNPDYFPLKIGN